MAVSTRPPQTYDPLSRLRDEFVVPFKARSYAQQFAKVYFLRLSRLRERLKEKCLERWKAQTPCRVLDIDPSRISVVIGTLYCEMKLKPNVLEDLAREVCMSCACFFF
jgi:DNA polymerase delta subunit 2